MTRSQPTALRAALGPITIVARAALAAAALAWLTVSGASAQAAGDCTVNAADLAIDSEEQLMMTLINQYRQQNNIPALSLQTQLIKAATLMSRNMATQGFFDHTDPSGRNPFQRMVDCGHTSPGGKGENIAAGRQDAATTLTDWKNSPSHNRLLLDGQFRFAGIARVGNPSSQYRWYWTLDVATDSVGGAGNVVSNPQTGQSTLGAQTTGTGLPATSAQNLGTVAISLNLVSANNQPASGDLSGYQFTLSGTGGTFALNPTNAQGVTSAQIPAGMYTVAAQPRADAAVLGLTAGGLPASVVIVQAGATAAVTATSRLATPANVAAPATTTTTTTTAATPAATANPITVATGSSLTTSTVASPATATTAAPTSAAPAGVAQSPRVEAVALRATCNNVALTWPEGTPLSVVAAAVSPLDSLAGIWRYDAARDLYLAYSPEPGSPADYSVITSRLEPVFVCMKSGGALSRPFGS